MKYIGIIGARSRNAIRDFLVTRRKFFELYEPGDIIVSGGCPQGGDAFAEALAKETMHNPIIFLPNKNDLDPILLTRNIRAAYAQINYARNTLIAEKADILIACVSNERKGGTEDTINKFQRKCVQLRHKRNETLFLV